MKTSDHLDKPVIKSPASDRVGTPARATANRPVSASPRQLRQERHITQLSAANTTCYFDDPLQLKGRREKLALDDIDGEPHPPLVVKLIIAGSGYDRWATHIETVEGKTRTKADKKWTRQDDQQDPSEPTYHRRDKEAGKKAQVSFAGPGAETSKGASVLGGVRDVGSNSIESLVTEVPAKVTEIVEQQRAGTDPRRRTVILIKAHSRGAVAASRVAKLLNKTIGNADIELVLFDPVPGPKHEGEDIQIDLSGLKEFTLVYSVASGYGEGFDPQTVFGAKRIIISRQNHSAGLAAGFNFNGEIHKGSDLNSLPPGVYVDFNEDGKNSVPLELVASIQTAMQRFDAAYKQSAAPVGDSDRRDIVKTVLQEFFYRG